jgi:transposase
MVRSKVELFEEIRVDHRSEELSIRELAARFKVHRRTVRQALASATPAPRKEYRPRARPAIDPWKDVIDAWLTGDRQAPAKQRHTARRVWQRLVAEHGADLSEVTVSRYVAVRRRELGLDRVEVFVPQAHDPGAEAEVDFGEFGIRLRGQDLKVWMFAMRLSASGRAFHYAFANQAQEAFLEGHVRAFASFGGVPARIRYDNLKPAVVRILKGRDRVENDRFTAMRSHYRFESFFCAPGKDGAHEKGGIEGEIGRFRRRHLVPVPDVADVLHAATRWFTEPAAGPERTVHVTFDAGPEWDVVTRKDEIAETLSSAALRDLIRKVTPTASHVVQEPSPAAAWLGTREHRRSSLELEVSEWGDDAATTLLVAAVEACRRAGVRTSGLVDIAAQRVEL